MLLRALPLLLLSSIGSHSYAGDPCEPVSKLACKPEQVITNPSFSKNQEDLQKAIDRSQVEYSGHMVFFSSKKTLVTLKVPSTSGSQTSGAWVGVGEQIGGYKVKSVSKDLDKIIVCHQGEEFEVPLVKSRTKNGPGKNYASKSFYLSPEAAPLGIFVPTPRSADMNNIPFTLEDIDGVMQIKSGDEVIFSEIRDGGRYETESEEILAIKSLKDGLIKGREKTQDLNESDLVSREDIQNAVYVGFPTLKKNNDPDSETFHIGYVRTSTGKIILYDGQLKVISTIQSK